MTGIKTEKIYDKEGNLLAFVLRAGDYPEGLNFYNEDRDFIQVGTWKYRKGKKIKTHNHLIFERKAERTQEVVFVKKGKMRLDIYDEQDDLLKSVVLTAGDVALQLAGGHGFEILKDDTQILEVKNGPYFGPEKDKRKFNGKNEK